MELLFIFYLEELDNQLPRTKRRDLRFAATSSEDLNLYTPLAHL